MTSALADMPRTLTGLLLTGQLVLSGACVSDGAVRLAYCIEQAAAELELSKEEEIREECDLGIPGGSRVVAFPPTPVSSARLEAQGLSRSEIRTINQLQTDRGPYARLNVLPAHRRPRASRTTYHRRFVETPELLVCRARASQVVIVLRREQGWIVLAEIE